MPIERDYYGYHPMSTLSLGGGFSPNDLSATKLRALDFEVQRLEAGANATSFSEVLVRTSEQLKQTLNLDLSVDASYLAYKGGMRFSFDQGGLFARSAVSVVISATTEFGRLAMRNPTLTASAQRLIDRGDLAAFERAYGSRVVVLERRGASVDVILSIAEASSEARTRIGTTMSGSGGWGPLSVSAKASFLREMATAGQDGRLSVQVVSTGGQGLGGLAELVRASAAQTDAFAAIESALATYMQQFTIDNAAPIGFHTASMEVFGYQPSPADLWSERKERRLLRLVQRYREVEGLIAQAGAIARGDDPRARVLGAEQRAAIRDAAPRFERYLDELAEAHARCKASAADDDACDVPAGDVPPDGVIPPIPRLVQGSVRYQVAGEIQDAATSRVLDETYHGGPGPNGAQLVCLLDGAYLRRVRLFFESQLLSDHAFNTATSPLVLAAEQLAVDQWIHGWISTNARPNATGCFHLLVGDAFGRERRVDVATATWSSAISNKRQIVHLARQFVYTEFEPADISAPPPEGAGEPEPASVQAGRPMLLVFNDAIVRYRPAGDGLLTRDAAPAAMAEGADAARWMAPPSEAERLARDVTYLVPGAVPAIRQPTAASGWITTYAMLQGWKAGGAAPDLGDVAAALGEPWERRFHEDRGLSPADAAEFADRAGLDVLLAERPSAQGWAELLRAHGPLWVTAAGGEAAGDAAWRHGMLLTGVVGDGSDAGTTYRVIDPGSGLQRMLGQPALVATIARWRVGRTPTGEPLPIAGVEIVHLAERVAAQPGGLPSARAVAASRAE